ncbi:MerR family DNA-binding transcriptional regulator [Streptomyces sp. 3N207]|uniref:MerR family DNA-binding transcriptional regulator n=1 Tax=Streptomyces sp. 3N207 TaxID=3457417 RepID=UPI003FD51359
MRTQLLRIREAAERLGGSTHLLRHWEAEGVITPHRTASGVRPDDPELLDALSIAVKCQQGRHIAQRDRSAAERPATRTQAPSR